MRMCGKLIICFYLQLTGGYTKQGAHRQCMDILIQRLIFTDAGAKGKQLQKSLMIQNGRCIRSIQQRLNPAADPNAVVLDQIIDWAKPERILGTEEGITFPYNKGISTLHMLHRFFAPEQIGIQDGFLHTGGIRKTSLSQFLV